jgi:hypothetical protein
VIAVAHLTLDVGEKLAALLVETQRTRRPSESLPLKML